MDARQKLIRLIVETYTRGTTVPHGFMETKAAEAADGILAAGWPPPPEPEDDPVKVLARELHDIGRDALKYEPCAQQWVDFSDSISAKACLAIAAHVRRLLMKEELRGLDDEPYIQACIRARYPDVKD